MHLATTNTPATTEKSNALFQLIEAYNQQKAILDDAKAKFAAIEAELTEEVGYKHEGSFTTHIDGFKVTTTGRMTRKIDEKAWAIVAPKLPETLRNMLVRYKPELNIRTFKELETANPAAYAEIAKCITAKPGKPSLKVEAA